MFIINSKRQIQTPKKIQYEISATPFINVNGCLISIIHCFLLEQLHYHHPELNNNNNENAKHKHQMHNSKMLDNGLNQRIAIVTISDMACCGTENTVKFHNHNVIYIWLPLRETKNLKLNK